MSLRVAFGVLAAALAWPGEEPAVSRARVRIGTVERGEFPVVLRAAGILSGNRAAELRIPEREVERIRPGQPASVEIQGTLVPGRVAEIRRRVSEGLVPVLVDLEGPLPDPLRPRQAVSATIRVASLEEVVHVGRPAGCTPGGEGYLFKLSADGNSAVKVKVLYGQASYDRVEIRAGLAPGDRVILSDMSAYRRDERVLLR